MFGYVAPLKSELKVREFEIYRAYYCAICRAVKRRYGEAPRLTLSYDAVFLAMLYAALAGAPDALNVREFRCLNNPFKKRNEAMPSEAIDYAADVMVWLGWASLCDGKRDRDAPNPLKGAAISLGEAALRGAGARAEKRLGEKGKICRECLDEQRALEAEKTPELDRAADPTGRMMAELLDFTGFAGISEKLRGLGYHLGRYIYIIDAISDLEKDRKSGAYNPLLLRPQSAETLKTALSLDLARLGEAAGELPLNYHNNIIENIVFLGLRAKLDEALTDWQRG